MVFKKVASWTLALALAAMVAMLIGCSSGSGEQVTQEEQQSPEDVVANAEVHWNGYVMGFDQVTDNPDDITSNVDKDFEGKAIKICFRYISDDANSGGFVSENLLDELEADQIVLTNANGDSYTWSQSIGDIEMEGDFAAGDLRLAETMDRFSIAFDVPADSTTADYTLTTSEGDSIPLANYTSEAYAADKSDE